MHTSDRNFYWYVRYVMSMRSWQQSTKRTDTFSVKKMKLKFTYVPSIPLCIKIQVTKNNKSQSSLYFKTRPHQKHPILGTFQGQLLHPLIFSFSACLDYENKRAMTRNCLNPGYTKSIKNKAFCLYVTWWPKQEQCSILKYVKQNKFNNCAAFLWYCEHNKELWMKHSQCIPFDRSF